MNDINNKLLKVIGAMDGNGSVVWTIDYLKSKYPNFWDDSILDIQASGYLHSERFKTVFEKYPKFLSNLRQGTPFLPADRKMILNVLKSELIKLDNQINNFAPNLDDMERLLNIMCDVDNFNDLQTQIQRQWSNYIDNFNTKKGKRRSGFLGGHLENLFSLIKHLQSPDKFVVNYKYWKGTLGILFNNGKPAQSYQDLLMYFQMAGATEGPEFNLNMYVYAQTIHYSFLREHINRSTTTSSPEDDLDKLFVKVLNNINETSFAFIKQHKKHFDDILTDSGTSTTYDSSQRIQITQPHQRIFFGAPGTGKSFNLNQEATETFENNFERVTFHPNYMYGNFVGAFKPFPEKTGEKYANNYEKEVITYKYVPGPLMRKLVEALINRDKNYLLVIEEINRANASAVFGDLFQLLDRNSVGESQYPITTSEELRVYLTNSLSCCDEETKAYVTDKLGSKYEQLIFPSNLYIWSTMNSADQGVMPLDTAFKRRWEFTYIGVDDLLKNPNIQQEFENYRFRLSESETVSWNEFRTKINERLSDCKVPEDKLIGPYFISKNILESRDVDKLTETVQNKVLMYLYDDAVKVQRNWFFDPEKSKTFSMLCDYFIKDGKSIFKPALEVERSIESSTLGDQEDSSTVSTNQED
jgi:hypothetical protein